MAAIIDHIIRTYGPAVVNLEGGDGDYDISVFTTISGATEREGLTHAFMKSGLINGAEYYAANNPENVTLWGIEDAHLYLENLGAYRASRSNSALVDGYIKKLSSLLAALKLTIYSKALLELDLAYSRFKAGAIDLRAYISYLISTAAVRSIDLASYPDLALLKKSVDSEAGIDFKQANAERDQLIDILQKSLSRREVEELVQKSVAFKMGSLSQRDYYAYLMKKASAVGAHDDRFPELVKYRDYVATYAAIDNIKAMNDIDSLEARIKGVLCQNDTQAELVRLSKNLAILKNLFGATLSRADYAYYKTHQVEFDARNFTSFITSASRQSLVAAELDDAMADLDRYRRDMEKFYEYSIRRDEAFVRNIRIEGQRKNIAIVVTGGFHTENLCELFRKNNIAYVSIMPNFRNEKGYECPYFKLLAGNPYAEFVKMAQSSRLSALMIPSNLNSLGKQAADLAPVQQTRETIPLAPPTPSARVSTPSIASTVKMLIAVCAASMMLKAAQYLGATPAAETAVSNAAAVTQAIEASELAEAQSALGIEADEKILAFEKALRAYRMKDRDFDSLFLEVIEDAGVDIVFMNVDRGYPCEFKVADRKSGVIYFDLAQFTGEMADKKMVVGLAEELRHAQQLEWITRLVEHVPTRALRAGAKAMLSDWYVAIEGRAALEEGPFRYAEAVRESYGLPQTDTWDRLKRYYAVKRPLDIFKPIFETLMLGALLVLIYKLGRWAWRHGRKAGSSTPPVETGWRLQAPAVARPGEARRLLVEQVTREFGLGNKVQVGTAQGGGGRKSTSIPVLTTEEGTFAIKHIKKIDTEDGVLFLMDYIRHLIRHGIPIPSVCKKGTDGSRPEDYFVKLTNPDTGATEYYSVDKWVQGRVVNRSDAKPADLRAAGRILGRIHAAGLSFTSPHSLSTDPFNIKSVIARITEPGARWYRNLQGKLGPAQQRIIDRSISEIRAYWQAHPIGQLPGPQPIPSDMNFGNLIFQEENDEVKAVFDWDNARIGYRAEDFFATLVNTGRRSGRRTRGLRADLKNLLAGWEEGIGQKLTRNERDAMSMLFLTQILGGLANRADTLQGTEGEDDGSMRYMRDYVIPVLTEVRRELSLDESFLTSIVSGIRKIIKPHAAIALSAGVALPALGAATVAGAAEETGQAIVALRSPASEVSEEMVAGLLSRRFVIWPNYEPAIAELLEQLKIDKDSFYGHEPSDRETNFVRRLILLGLKVNPAIMQAMISKTDHIVLLADAPDGLYHGYSAAIDGAIFINFKGEIPIVRPRTLMRLFPQEADVFIYTGILELFVHEMAHNYGVRTGIELVMPGIDPTLDDLLKGPAAHRGSGLKVTAGAIASEIYARQVGIAWAKSKMLFPQRFINEEQYMIDVIMSAVTRSGKGERVGGKGRPVSIDDVAGEPEAVKVWRYYVMNDPGREDAAGPVIAAERLIRKTFTAAANIEYVSQKLKTEADGAITGYRLHFIVEGAAVHVFAGFDNTGAMKVRIRPDGAWVAVADLESSDRLVVQPAKPPVSRTKDKISTVSDIPLATAQALIYEFEQDARDIRAAISIGDLDFADQETAFVTRVVNELLRRAYDEAWTGRERLEILRIVDRLRKLREDLNSAREAPAVARSLTAEYLERIPVIGTLLAYMDSYTHEFGHAIADGFRGTIMVARDAQGRLFAKYLAADERGFQRPKLVLSAGPAMTAIAGAIVAAAIPFVSQFLGDTPAILIAIQSFLALVSGVFLFDAAVNIISLDERSDGSQLAAAREAIERGRKPVVREAYNIEIKHAPEQGVPEREEVDKIVRKAGMSTDEIERFPLGFYLKVWRDNPEDPLSIEEHALVFDYLRARKGTAADGMPASLRMKLIQDARWWEAVSVINGTIFANDINALEEIGLDREEKAYLWNRFHETEREKSNRSYDDIPGAARAAISGAVLRAPYGARVLDIGCGETARLMSDLKRMYGQRIEAHGVDIAPGNPHDAGVTVTRADVTQDALPYADASFDVVYEAAVLDHFKTDDELRHLFREIARIMKPGASLVLMSYGASEQADRDRFLGYLGDGFTVIQNGTLVIAKDRTRFRPGRGVQGSALLQVAAITLSAAVAGAAIGLGYYMFGALVAGLTLVLAAAAYIDARRQTQRSSADIMIDSLEQLGRKDRAQALKIADALVSMAANDPSLIATIITRKSRSGNYTMISALSRAIIEICATSKTAAIRKEWHTPVWKSLLYAAYDAQPDGVRHVVERVKQTLPAAEAKEITVEMFSVIIDTMAAGRDIRSEILEAIDRTRERQLRGNDLNIPIVRAIGANPSLQLSLRAHNGGARLFADLPAEKQRCYLTVALECLEYLDRSVSFTTILDMIARSASESVVERLDTPHGEKEAPEKTGQIGKQEQAMVTHGQSLDVTDNAGKQHRVMSTEADRPAVVTTSNDPASRAENKAEKTDNVLNMVFAARENSGRDESAERAVLQLLDNTRFREEPRVFFVPCKGGRKPYDQARSDIKRALERDGFTNIRIILYDGTAQGLDEASKAAKENGLDLDDPNTLALAYVDDNEIPKKTVISHNASHPRFKMISENVPNGVPVEELCMHIAFGLPVLDFVKNAQDPEQKLILVDLIEKLVDNGRKDMALLKADFNNIFVGGIVLVLKKITKIDINKEMREKLRTLTEILTAA